MIRIYKFRLYPTKSQIQILERTLNTCRILYNNSLNDRKFVYDNSGESIFYYDQANALPLKKKDNIHLSEVYAQVLQDVLRRVDKAFKSFFRRVQNGKKSGYPRFKGENRYDSFTYPQLGFEIKNCKLILSKIGSIKIKLHRFIPIGTNVKTCTIKRDVDQWHVYFTVEFLDNLIPKKEIKNAIGIDVGLNSIVTLSDGTKIGNPKWLGKSEKKLAKEQRKLSRKKKRAKNRNNQRMKVARIHRKIKNQRKDFYHKLSKNMVNNYDLVIFENLYIKNMIKNPYLAKSITDASWKQLTHFTSYKAEEAGGIVEFVNPRGTSRECSNCGESIPMPLSKRMYKCPSCKMVKDRDWNSAINILNRGLEIYTSGTGGRACLSSLIGDTMIQETVQLIGW